MKTRPATLLVPLLAFLALAWVGLARWNVGRSGAYDLGVFSQAAQSWADGRLPFSAIRGLPLLGEHFSPVTVLWGAAWWVWPDPRSLVVVQAAALAVAAGIVHRAARRVLGPGPALVVAGLFTVSYGVVNVARLDVHEVCFATPLVAASCAALLQRRWTAALGWSLPLLLVKEDQGPTVVAVAFVVFLLARGRFRWFAAATAVLAVLGTVAAFAVIAWRNPDHVVPLFEIRFDGAPPEPFSWSGDVLPRLELPAAVLLTGGVLWVGSPIALVALPTLAWRLLSPYESYWSTRFHYDAVLMPMVFLALVDVLRRRRRWLPVVVALSLVCAGWSYQRANFVANPLDADTWRPSQATRDLLAVSAEIPAGSVVAADNGAGPYLVADHTVRVLGNGESVEARWVVVDTRIDGASATREGKLALVEQLTGPQRSSVGRIVRIGSVVAVEMPCEGPVWLPEPAGNPPLPTPAWISCR
ncbi:DUF2079 domain-containing protein [Kineococcus sp. SYSU DK003]|uniref:DUF2079 domain-containing protein n=1 Tax=Kineococcus sp. SYSU DK003 TaxID=3383124 RepID=UPI003D7E8960